MKSRQPCCVQLRPVVDSFWWCSWRTDAAATCVRTWAGRWRQRRVGRADDGRTETWSSASVGSRSAPANSFTHTRGTACRHTTAQTHTHSHTSQPLAYRVCCRNTRDSRYYAIIWWRPGVSWFGTGSWHPRQTDGRTDRQNRHS